jgi:hypothetical protein
VKLVVQDRDRGEVLFARAAAGQGAGSALSVHALRGSEVGAASVAASTGEAMERLCRLVSAGP